MPSEDELPAGNVRRFVEALSELHRASGRFPLRTVEAKVRERAETTDLTASRELVRRMLHGESVPSQWAPVEATLMAMCDLGDMNPDDEVPNLNVDDGNGAVEDPTPWSRPPANRVPAQDSGWGSGAASGWGPQEPHDYPQEPPF
jgi:hypothetical protein